jgi:hypothetical protein
MALIDDRQAPADVPTTNELDQIPDDMLGYPPGPQNVMLGTSVLMAMDPPPKTGDYIDVAMRLRVKRTAEDKPTVDSPLSYPRYCEIVVAWPLGEEMPKPKKSKAEEDAEAEAEAAEDQPPLFGDDGEPETMGEIADELLGEELADAAGVDFEGGPAFSDGGE